MLQVRLVSKRMCKPSSPTHSCGVHSDANVSIGLTFDTLTIGSKGNSALVVDLSHPERPFKTYSVKLSIS